MIKNKLSFKYIALYAIIAGLLLSLTPFSLAFIPNDHGHKGVQLLDAGVILVLNTLLFFCSLWLNLRVSSLIVLKRIVINLGVYFLLTVIAILIHRPIWLMLEGLPISFFIRDEFIHSLIIFSISYIVAQAYDNFLQNQLMKNRIFEIQRESLSVQIESLKQQINPHFFFNSLNTLSGLAQEDPKKTVEFIEKLSQVFRYVLDIQEKNMVSLTDELNFAKAYIYLMKVRFAEKFTVYIDVQTNGGETVPGLCTQLLLENCFKHNAMSSVNPLKIRIFTANSHLVVSNSLAPLNNSSGNGIGLRNLNERCLLLTGKPIEIIKDDDLFAVKVPFNN